MKKGIVLFGHGSRNADWRLPFDAIQREIHAKEPETLVEQGFLELMSPSLPQAIEKLAQAGAKDIVVVPVFISAGNHVREDLPGLVETAKKEYPDVQVRVSPPLGEVPEIIAALAAYSIRAAALS